MSKEECPLIELTVIFDSLHTIPVSIQIDPITYRNIFIHYQLDGQAILAVLLQESTAGQVWRAVDGQLVFEDELHEYIETLRGTRGAYAAFERGQEKAPRETNSKGCNGTVVNKRSSPAFNIRGLGTIQAADL